MAKDTGNPDEARRLFQQGLTIAERLAAQDPGNVGFQRDLAISRSKLANLARGTDPQ